MADSVIDNVLRGTSAPFSFSRRSSLDEEYYYTQPPQKAVFLVKREVQPDETKHLTTENAQEIRILPMVFGL